MDGQATRYAVLRDGHAWEGKQTRLEALPDGARTLARVPGPAGGEPIEIGPPYEVVPLGLSGVAAGTCGDLYIADTAANQIVFIDGVCEREGSRTARIVAPGCKDATDAPGHFRQPRGLLVHPPGGLYVADSGNGRVQVLRLPTLEVHTIWSDPLDTPVALAADSQGRIYVLDLEQRRVVRFSTWGVADTAYNLVPDDPIAFSPVCLAIDNTDTLYVSDNVANTVWRFGPDGASRGALPPQGPLRPLLPRAIAAHGNRLFIADADNGRIWVFDRQADAYLGTIPGYRGPVAALATSPDGALIIKPGPGTTTHRFAADAAFVSSGELLAGPLDAGERQVWTRVSLQAEEAPGTHMRLQIALTDEADSQPDRVVWQDSPGPDMLIVPPETSSNLPPQQRYLWLRVLLSSDNGRASPRLLQVRAETTGESYLSYLPRMYREVDAATGFLHRLLELFRSELGDLELLLDDMPGRFDPMLAPQDDLDWLAGWLAFDPPDRQQADELRALLPHIVELYAARGTIYGLLKFVQLYTGAHPHIFEAYRERRIWQLDHTSALGFDTALPATGFDGMIVPDTTADPVVGETIVGQSGPLAASDIGEPLFSTAAHFFTILVPAAQIPSPKDVEALLRIIDAEKPAHTDYHLCRIEARMRVGFQARIGIDSIVAGPPAPLTLTGTWLDIDAVLGGEQDAHGTGRVGERARIGRDTVIG